MGQQNFQTGRFVAGLLCGLVAVFYFGKDSKAGTINYTLITDIREVNTGTVDGLEYLTIEINRVVGPIECRSNVLRVDTTAAATENIETLALSALMQQEQVMITVPLQQSDCVDGNPSIVGLYTLHNF